ncbi:MAG: hypothetical protein QG620_571 [Patescibacteria group bacterium]|nr:hypothetical protein [Patescibacteria group bacterium]
MYSHLSEFITINGTTYKIEHSLFKKLLSDFDLEGLIKKGNYLPIAINEAIKDPLVFGSEEIERNRFFSYDKLDEDSIFEYEIVLKNLEKIKEKISFLNSLNISLHTLPFGADTAKINLSINASHGIKITKEGVEYFYPIKGNRFKIIEFLKDGKKPGEFLAKMQGRPLSLIIKEISAINELFKKLFKKIYIKDNLIVHVKTGGYELNRQKFDITFTDNL